MYLHRCSSRTFKNTILYSAIRLLKSLLTFLAVALQLILAQIVIRWLLVIDILLRKKPRHPVNVVQDSLVMVPTAQVIQIDAFPGVCWSRNNVYVVACTKPFNISV